LNSTLALISGLGLGLGLETSGLGLEALGLGLGLEALGLGLEAFGLVLGLETPGLVNIRALRKDREYVAYVFYVLKDTHTTLFTKAWQIQNIDISVRKEKNIYKQKINRCKIILTTVNQKMK